MLEIRIHRETVAYPAGSTLGSDGAGQFSRDIDPRDHRETDEPSKPEIRALFTVFGAKT